MKRALIILLALIAALLLSLPAWAGEGDASTRFHDAYVQEVIEGKVAEAARVYLALMEDEQVPARLRAESRLRFAICAVLLGRADEGRAHLGQLIDDADAPAAVRKRAREYLESVAEIEIGSEMDKKLQSLVFDLGRQDPRQANIAVYRDFEIIGKRSIPFLKKLLQHTDTNLREHAFRLLCRMKEPGMAALWEPGLQSGGGRDFLGYLTQQKEERKQFEKRVIEMGETGWNAVRYWSTGPIWSRPFVRAFAETKIAPGTAVAWLGYVLKDADFDQLIEWMDGPDVALADAAADWILKYGAQHERADAALYAKLFERLMTRVGEKDTKFTSQGLSNFEQFSARMSPDTILDGLESTIADVEGHGGTLDEQFAARSLMPMFAKAFETKKAKPPEAARYAGLLERWIALREASNLARRKAGQSGVPYPPHVIAPHLLHVLRDTGGLEEGAAIALVRRIFAVPGRSNHAHWIQMLPPSTDARSVRLAAAAIAAAPEGSRSALFPRVNVKPSASASPELKTATDQARLGLVDQLGVGDLARLFRAWDRTVGQRPSVEVQAQFLLLLQKARTLDEKKRAVLLTSVFSGSTEYFEKVLAPIATDQWELLSVVERRRMLQQALAVLKTRDQSDVIVRTRRRDMAAAVLRSHLKELEGHNLSGFVDDPKRFPLEEWLPLVPDTSALYVANKLKRVSAEAADELVRKILVDRARINGMVLRFTSAFASAEMQQKVFDSVLKSADAERRMLALGLTSNAGDPASPEALEAVVDIELASKPVDLGRLRIAGTRLLRRRPSSKLFPVARLLMASADRAEVLAGISMANSLGRADLQEDLMKHLTSMDESIRFQAKKAVAAIQAISRIQAGLPPGDK